MKKTFVIGITGPESSGKSTLAQSLAEKLECPSCSEYARDYLDAKEGEYEYDDLEIIAKEQSKLWFGAILRRPKILVLDTELTVIKIWSEYKYNKTSPWVEEHYINQNIDLYLLCKNDLHWEDDPLRENPDPKERDVLFNLYLDELKILNRNFEIISGTGNERIKKALNFIEQNRN